MKLLLILLFLIFAIEAHSETWNCSKGGIKRLRNNTQEVASVNICIDLSGNRFASQDCKIEKSCPLLKKLRSHKFLNYQMVSPTSNPGFKLCKEIGMGAFIVKYDIGGKEIPSNICETADQKSFVSTNYLLEKYLEINSKK